MDATQIILIVFIVLLIIIYPILISARNKKENQKLQEQTNSLKRGDKIITTSGVYGTIIDLHLDDNKKIVTIETGTGKNKGYVSIDAYSIYTIIKDEQTINGNAKTQDVNITEPLVEEQSNDVSNFDLTSNNENDTEQHDSEENAKKKSKKDKKKD